MFGYPDETLSLVFDILLQSEANPKHTSKIPNFNLNLADMFLFIKMPGGKLCHLANVSSAKIGQFGVPYFHKFAADVLETTQI